LISIKGEYEIAGSNALYDREEEKETLKIPGPINQNLSVYVSHFFFFKLKFNTKNYVKLSY
jgi:hypothetical protein